MPKMPKARKSSTKKSSTKLTPSGTSLNTSFLSGGVMPLSDYFSGQLRVKPSAGGWKTKFCALNKDVGLLSVYRSEVDRNLGKRQMCINLLRSTSSAIEGTKTQFTITDSRGKVHKFKAFDMKERSKWLSRIHSIVNAHSSVQQAREEKLKRDCEKGDPETIYYESLKTAERHLNAMMSKRRDMKHKVKEDYRMGEKEKQILNDFFESSGTFIDAIIEAVNKLEQTRDADSDMGTPEGGETKSTSKNKTPKFIRKSTWSDTQTEWFDAKAEQDQSTPSESSAGDPSTNKPISTKSKTKTKSKSKSEDQDAQEEEEDHSASPLPETAYEADSSEDEGPDGTENKKILKSIMGNIKGGDLSKTGMPVFVLAKLSFLEKFANYFSNADYFPGYSHVPIGDTPKDRLLGVVKWYLSSFRPGWSDRSKKPYNPILGEFFECYYYLSDMDKIQSNNQNFGHFLETGGLDRSGSRAGSRCSTRMDVSGEAAPVAWAGEEDVIFLAEQVSHHPPISAFYAESLKKRVQVTGHVLATSKMKGFSAVLKMNGEALLKYLDHKETYRITYPTVYGRNVLSTPWAELGDEGTITCLETGYRADITFHTKGSFGSASNLHQVTGKLYDKTDKQFALLKGHWNQTVRMYTGDDCDNKKLKLTEDMMEDFLFVEGMAILKKRVRPLEEQQPNESRRVWQHLTENLKEKCWPEAETAKHEVEQEQREKKKQRDETGEEWITKYFEVYKTEKDLDYWRYKNDLETREKENAKNN